MKPLLQLGLVGAAGRMGKAVQALAAAHGFAVAQSWEATSQPDSTPSIDVVIDFSSPQATLQWVQVAVAKGWPMVVGTTGLLPAQMQTVQSAASQIPLFYSANMSVGFNIMLQAAQMIAARLSGMVDTEIIETHHKHKKDAPSGSALSLAKAVQTQKIHSLRLGEVVGEHEVIFATAFETLRLKHQAQDRHLFAAGALQVAHWLVGKKPGYYTMQDYLEVR